MTAITLAGGRDLLADGRDRWRRTPPRAKTTARVAALLGMVLVAYHYSLSSLIGSLSLETPLAYVGLTPVIALGIAALRARPARTEPAIHDRQLDYIVGLPLLMVAVAVNVVFPQRLSTMFWVWRIDLFTLPFFVAGAVAILFGVRTMWRQRLAIGFLFLAWPLPYQVLLLRFLPGFTDLTLVGVKALLGWVPVAKEIPSADGSLFQVLSAKPFQISVVSACSGVNGMVGFLLVGIAFGAVVRGPRIRKGLWLLGGLALLWTINLGRILFIFWSGKQWGEDVAIDVFHPFIGLVTFNLGVLAMLLVLKPFGLSIGGVAKPSAKGVAAGGRRAAVPRIGVPVLLVVTLGGLLAITNSRLDSYDLVANAVGTPKLASFSDFPATPEGWRAAKTNQYDWAKPYFGESSTWLRYTMSPGTSPDLALRSIKPVTADVISTSNLRSFSAYGVEACYRFHGYKLRDVASVSLGGGVTGQTLSFYNSQQKQDWTVAYWIWPVRHGEATRYERVTLYIQDSGDAGFGGAAEVDGVRSLRGGLAGTDPVARKLVSVRSFMVEFARSVVQNQTEVEPGTRLPAARTAVPPTPSNLLRPRKAPAAAGTPLQATGPVVAVQGGTDPTLQGVQTP